MAKKKLDKGASNFDMNDKVLTLALAYYISGIDQVRVLIRKYIHTVSFSNKRILRSLLKQPDDVVKRLLDLSLEETSRLLYS